MSRPFNSTRYAELLEGLDVTVLKLSEVKADNEKFRFDDGYFAKVPVQTQRRIESLPHIRLGELCSVFRKGIFDIKADSYTESGVPFIRIGNLRGGLIDISDAAFIPPAAHAVESNTALEFGDIVLSKTAYAAASFVNVPECNVSQDTIAVKLSVSGQEAFKSGYIVAYLNSRYGLALMERQFQGNVQAHLSLPDGRKIPVPKFGTVFQTATDAALKSAHQSLRQADEQMAEAEATLTAALGLGDWQPPEPLTYTRRASEVFAAARVDAEFYHPAKRGYLERLAAMPGQPLSAHYDSVRDMLDPAKAPKGQFVRNFDLNDALQPVLDDTRPPGPARELGSAKKCFQPGDVVTSRLRAYLRETALVRTTSEIPAVGSSEFIVLRPHEETPRLSRATLLTFLRSQPVQTILQWSQEGNQHPRYDEDNLLNIPIPDSICAVSAKIDALFDNLLTARTRARTLLAAAQHAVEIAIEQNESAALEYLGSFSL